jgi:hypothetical protein
VSHRDEHDFIALFKQVGSEKGTLVCQAIRKIGNPVSDKHCQPVNLAGICYLQQGLRSTIA